MNAKTLEAITRHGNALLAIFPNATERDPVALCKKLRRIETAVSKPLMDYCNGDCAEDLKLHAVAKAIDRTRELLGMDKAQQLAFFVNGDPRGYALKMEDEWTRAYNFSGERKQGPKIRLHTDMGGYGILAPDLNA